MKRVLSTAVVLPLLFLASCVGFGMLEQENRSEPKADSDKALLVVMRTTSYGFGVVMNSYVDGKYIGRTKGKCYYFTKLDPGEHWVMGESENRAVAKMTFEAGKVYYLEQLVVIGIMKARTGWHPRDPEYFRGQLPELTYLVVDPNSPQEDMDADDLAEDKQNHEKEIKKDPERHKNTLEYQGYE